MDDPTLLMPAKLSYISTMCGLKICSLFLLFGVLSISTAQEATTIPDSILTKYGTWVAEARNPNVSWECSPMGIATFHISLDSAGTVTANLESLDGKPSMEIFKKDLPAGENQVTQMLPILKDTAFLAIQIPRGQCRFRFLPTPIE